MKKYKIRDHLCYIILFIFLSSIISCSSGGRDGEAPSSDAAVQKIDIEMKRAAISPNASSYTEIYLKISGPDIEPAIERTTEDITTPIQFSIYVPPGKDRTILAQARDSQNNVIFEGSVIVDIEPDVPITMNIFISPGDYSISGRLILFSGVGLVRAMVTLSGSSPLIPEPVYTDCSGTYTFSGLYNGDYTVTPSITGFDFDQGSIKVTVKDEDVTGQDFRSVDRKFIYVDNSNSNCTLDCDGSMSKPYKTIQEGIDNAPEKDTVIRVAGGEERWYNESIIMKSYITLKGGYDPEFKKRDIINYITIIDGFNLNKGMVIFNNIHSAMIDGFIISDGSTTNEGGGIAINSSCSIAVTHNTIKYNEAISNGGGIYLDSSSSIVMENNFITNNQTYKGQGGGIFISNSSSNITNNTISNNYSANCAKGSGVYVDSGTINIKNSIIWDNCENYDNTDLYVVPVVPPSSVTVTYSDLKWTNIDIYDPPNTNNISFDPLFVNFFNDYHITGSSPCIDYGTSDGAPTDDIDGQQRGNDGDGKTGTGDGSEFDIGADEYYYYPEP